MTQLTFDQWIEKINSILEMTIGVTTDDIPDMCYQDMYEAGATVKEVVNEILQEWL